RAAGHAPRAHGFPERRSPPHRVPRGPRAPCRVRPRMAVTAVTTVAVVGAGIAGLAAAWGLEQAGVAVTVLESERRPGGVIVTERRGGLGGGGGAGGCARAGPASPRPAGGARVRGRVRGAATPGAGGGESTS